MTHGQACTHSPEPPRTPWWKVVAALTPTFALLLGAATKFAGVP